MSKLHIYYELLVNECGETMKCLSIAETFACAPEVSRRQHTSSDSPERRTHQSPSASRRRDPARVTLRSAVVDEMKENVSPSRESPLRRRTSPELHWTERQSASTVFTVTGCPRTAHTEDHSARPSLPVSNAAAVHAVATAKALLGSARITGDRGIPPHCSCQSIYFTIGRPSAPRCCPH